MTIEKNEYKFRDDLYNPKKGETVPIEILIWPFNGVVYRYEQVGVSENEDGTATLRFAYELLDCGEHTETKLRSDKKFEQHIGIILNHLILESVEADIASREGYSEEPDEERTVREESSPVSEG